MPKVRARRPWRLAFIEERALPSGVLGAAFSGRRGRGNFGDEGHDGRSGRGGAGEGYQDIGPNSKVRLTECSGS